MQATLETMDRINELTVERSRLYRDASNGRRTPETLTRIRALGAEIEGLWEQRRRERAGRVDGIDAIVDQQYQLTYGRGYEEILAPPTVGEPEDDKLLVAA